MSNRVSIEDFCMTLSAVDNRLEMVNAFYYVIKRKNMLFNTESEYNRLYKKFLTSSDIEV